MSEMSEMDDFDMRNVEMVMVQVPKYRDKESNLHNAEREAKLANYVIDGHARICPACSGTKKLASIDGKGSPSTCFCCDVDGLQWKHVVWNDERKKHLNCLKNLLKNMNPVK